MGLREPDWEGVPEHRATQGRETDSAPGPRHADR